MINCITLFIKLNRQESTATSLMKLLSHIFAKKSCIHYLKIGSCVIAKKSIQRRVFKSISPRNHHPRYIQRRKYGNIKFALLFRFIHVEVVVKWVRTQTPNNNWVQIGPKNEYSKILRTCFNVVFQHRFYVLFIIFITDVLYRIVKSLKRLGPLTMHFKTLLNVFYYGMHLNMSFVRGKLHVFIVTMTSMYDGCT